MASYIKPIPTLTGEVAERFASMAEKVEREYRASIDFSKQMETARSILKKAKLNDRQ